MNKSECERLSNVLKNPDGNFKLDISAKDARELLKFTRDFSGEHFILDALMSDLREGGKIERIDAVDLETPEPEDPSDP